VNNAARDGSNNPVLALFLLDCLLIWTKQVCHCKWWRTVSSVLNHILEKMSNASSIANVRLERARCFDINPLKL
jgi:hypothetical protein